MLTGVYKHTLGWQSSEFLTLWLICPIFPKYNRNWNVHQEIQFGKKLVLFESFTRDSNLYFSLVESWCRSRMFEAAPRARPPIQWRWARLWRSRTLWRAPCSWSRPSTTASTWSSVPWRRPTLATLCRRASGTSSWSVFCISTTLTYKQVENCMSMKTEILASCTKMEGNMLQFVFFTVIECSY